MFLNKKFRKYEACALLYQRMNPQNDKKRNEANSLKLVTYICLSFPSSLRTNSF